MGPFEVMTVAIVFAFSYKAYNAFINRDTVSNAQVDELQQEMVKLRERVATLEQLVTDKSYQLGEQIEKL